MNLSRKLVCERLPPPIQDESVGHGKGQRRGLAVTVFVDRDLELVQQVGWENDGCGIPVA